MDGQRLNITCLEEEEVVDKGVVARGYRDSRRITRSLLAASPG